MGDTKELRPSRVPRGSGSGLRRQVRRGTACLSCKTQRVKCDGAIPCQRCVRLGKNCEPQPPLSRRRRHGQQALTEAEMVAEGAAGAADYLTVQRNVATRFFRDLNPRELAEIACRLYINKVRDGSIGRRSAVWSLRNWLRKCWVCGSDASWGIIDAVMTEMGMTYVDLEQEAAAMELDYPMEQLRRQAAADLKQAQSLVPQVQASSDFQQADTAAACVYMGLFMGEGRIYVPAVNRVFNGAFRNNAEHFSDLIIYKTLDCLLCAAVIAPEDRELFLDMMLDTAMGNRPPRGSQLVKIRQRDGDIRLYVLQGQQHRVLSDGTPVSFVMRLEPAPPSRHLESSALASTRPRPPSQPIPQHQQLAAAGPVPGVAVLPLPAVDWGQRAAEMPRPPLPGSIYDPPAVSSPASLVSVESGQEEEEQQQLGGGLGLPLMSLCPTSAAQASVPSRWMPLPTPAPALPISHEVAAAAAGGGGGGGGGGSGGCLPVPDLPALAQGEGTAPPTFDTALLHEIFATESDEGSEEEEQQQQEEGRETS